MQDMLTFLYGRFTDFLEWMNTLQVAEGVSLLWLLAGFFVMYLIIHNFLLRGQ